MLAQRALSKFSNSESMKENEYQSYIPLDKSWFTRVGVLDIIHGYTDIEEFISSEQESSDDILAIKNASIAWRKNLPIRVGESATLYRLLRFASWKLGLQKKFIKEGSLKNRSMTDDRRIVKLRQTELLNLDHGTTQWATAAVICGDKERMLNPPLKLKETYQAVKHWQRKRKKGLRWEPKYDKTIQRQVITFLALQKNKKVKYTPLCSDDYCFARVFNYINKESGTKLWPSLVGHETNRIEEMENAILEAEETHIVRSKDHRVIQALAMWGILHKKKLVFQAPDGVTKSWPKFWKFLEAMEKNQRHNISTGKFEKPVRTIGSKKILDLITAEVKHEHQTLSLIPSENIMSELASSVYALPSNNRYVLKSKIGSKYFMPGREYLGDIISILENKLCRIYDVRYSITKGFSGLHNMDIIMSAMSKIASKMVIMDTLSGGHSKTKGLALKYGFEIETIYLDFNIWDLDYVNVKRIIKKWKNNNVFIYIDHTVTVNPLNIQKLMRTVPKNWTVYYDISHLQLLYFTHLYTFPKVSNFFFGGSTHKTFPGPQKSIILLDNKTLYNLIDAEFVKNTSSVHTGSLLALLVTVLEMEKFGKKYAQDVLNKTKVLAQLLNKKMSVIGPRPYLTNTHQICIDIPNIMEATLKLASVGLITLPMRTPSKNRSGLRLGIQELCRLGLNNKDLYLLSEIITACVLEKKVRVQHKYQVQEIAKRLHKVKYTLSTKKHF